MGSGDSHCNIALGPSDGARFYMRGMNESATMVLASVVVVSKIWGSAAVPGMTSVVWNDVSEGGEGWSIVVEVLWDVWWW